MKARAPRSILDMGPLELDAAIEQVCGLPMPPRDAPNYRELLAEHEVAANFLMFACGAKSIEAAKLAASAWTLSNPVLPVSELVPHIERGLGRKLLPVEIETGALSG